MATELKPKLELTGNMKSCYICGLPFQAPKENDIKGILGGKAEKGKQHIMCVHPRCYRNYVERA